MEGNISLKIYIKHHAKLIRYRVLTVTECVKAFVSWIAGMAFREWLFITGRGRVGKF